MRMSRDAMARHRKEIVAAASKMMRERGIAGTSVADLMQAANLTHGGFYRHFESKDALVAEAVASAFADHVGALAANSEKVGAAAAVTDYVGDYLTRRHLARPGVGCPMAALGGDGAREAKGARAAFADGTGKLIDMLAAAQTGRPAERRAKAIRLLASLVGAVVIARAVGDDKLGGEVLEACRETAAAPRQRRRQA